MKTIAFILAYCAALTWLDGWLRTEPKLPLLIDAKGRAGFICTPTITPQIRRVYPMEIV